LYLPKGSYCSFIRKKPSTYIHFSFDTLHPDANSNSFVREYSNSSQFRDLFTNLYNTQSAGKPGYEAQMLSIVYKIISTIQSREQSAYMSNKHYKKMSASLEFIEHNYQDNRITTPMLAEMSGMSLRYYNTLFTTFFGCSPKRYIMNKKIEEAKKMLLNTVLPIHEIALCGGFSDEFYFCKVFKREVGMTPTEFRRFNYIG
jgi:AraC-like DNA-binding protein